MSNPKAAPNTDNGSDSSKTPRTQIVNGVATALDPNTPSGYANGRHPNSLKNLRLFKKGHDDRRCRNIPAGRRIRDHLNTLANEDPAAAVFDEAAIRELAEDKSAPVARRVAAKIWLGALKDGYGKNGRPLAGEDIERLIAHTDGKATVRVETVQTPPRSLPELVSALRGLVERHPALRGVIDVERLAAIDVPTLPKQVENEAAGHDQDEPGEGGGAPQLDAAGR